MAIRVVGWNVAQRVQTVDELLDMDADVALLQEAGRGILGGTSPRRRRCHAYPQDTWEPWPREHHGFWPVVVKRSDRVEVD